MADLECQYCIPQCIYYMCYEIHQVAFLQACIFIRTKESPASIGCISTVRKDYEIFTETRSKKKLQQ